MQHPDEGMIHTWLDGELAAEEASALEAHAATCEQCKAAIAEARGFIVASSRIVSALDAVPSGVIPIAKKPAKRMWYSSPQFRAAAAVVVVAGASLIVMRNGSQKATLSSRAEANEAATAQRVVSASGSIPVSIPAPVRPPIVADQTGAKMGSAKPSSPSATGEVAALRAPAVAGTVEQKIPANEADFSGKGVKGGSASSVSGAAIPDTSAIVSAPAMKAADALSPRSAFALTQPELRALRVDSSVIGKNTIYQLASGRQVVLTEHAADMALSKVMVTGSPAENRETKALRATASANSPVARVAPAPAVQSESVVHTINWMDPSTRRRYTLSGPVSVEELEAIKLRLLQPRR